MEEPIASPPRRAAWRRWLGHARPALEAAAVGAVYGVINVPITPSRPWTSILLYLAACVIEGVRHAGRAWQCWLPLGASIYLAHVVGVGLGYRPPFVAEDAIAARQELFYFYPASLGLILGAGARFGLAALGLFPRQGGPPVSLIPRSTRGLFATVGGVAIFLFAMRWLAADATTVYAPGFSERKFAEVRIGQTADQVRANLGPPLRRHNFTVDRKPGTIDDGLWAYSLGAAGDSNFRRHWVVFDHDRVAAIIDDYHWDD